MADFKWRPFRGANILGCVRWYCQYGISYRELEEMMVERGVVVDHTTLYRWGHQYAPDIEKRLRGYWKSSLADSWRIDETYGKVKGTWTSLYRAIDKHGQTIDFYLSPTRTIKAAKRFLGKALNGMNAWVPPRVINTHKAPTYRAAMAALKEEGTCPPTTGHRQVKYLKNIVEADHGKLKRRINPTLGFQSLRTAYATIKGFEDMRTFRKQQDKGWVLEHPVEGEVRLIHETFGLDAV